jgi:hypothetical protein
MPTYQESSVRAAIQAIQTGTSVKRASEDYGIPRSTLRDRLQGKEPRSTAHAFQQKLSPIQETQLVDWILIQGALGLPPTHTQIRAFASRVLKANGSNEGIGKGWFQAFQRRNPAIKTLPAKRMASNRINGANTKAIQGFFTRLRNQALQNILPGDRYNMDETGIMEGQGDNGLVNHPTTTLSRYSRERPFIALQRLDILPNRKGLDIG